MTGSPLDPLEHFLISAAMALGAAALTTLSLVMFLRWIGVHWPWTLPGVLLWPLLWSFDQQAAVFAAGTALFATVTGARWHYDDLRHGADRAQDARTGAPRWMPAASACSAARCGAGGGSIAAASPSARISAAAPSAFPLGRRAAGTPSSLARRARARRSPRRSWPAA